MLDMLAAATAFVVLIAVAIVAFLAVSVVPFVLTLQMADARRFSPSRWGAYALSGTAMGLGLVYVLRSTEVPRPVVLVPLVLTWLGPITLWLLEEGQRIGGRTGAHE